MSRSAPSSIVKKNSRPRHELRVEKDIEIPLRDGVRLKADVFRPGGSGRFPALVNICAYQKDKTIGELADLPLGWTAWRDYVGGPWEREQKPEEEDEG